jgi:hypothetical protein
VLLTLNPGIYIGSEGNIAVSKNTIGSILVMVTVPMSLIVSPGFINPGIAGAMTVSYNVIGSTTTTSISATSASTSTAGQNLRDI